LTNPTYDFTNDDAQRRIDAGLFVVS